MIVKVIKKDSKGRGGFSFHNMGPDNKSVLPGTPFPSDWCDPDTLKRYMADDHIVEVPAAEVTIDAEVTAADTVEEPAKETATAEPDAPKEQDYTPEEMLEQLCVVPKEDLKKMSLEDINGMYEEICEQVGIEYVSFKGNEGKAEAITLLSSGATE